MIMKIGAIAEQLGTTVRTLRFYEAQGLVQPQRTPGGTRLYDEADVARFAAVLALARLGFSLQELAALAAVRSQNETGDAASRDVLARLAAMDQSLAAQAAAIKTQRRDLAQAQALVRRCQGCTQRPLRAVCDQCEVSRGVSDSQILQLVWEAPVRD
ncbi:MerR family transcriptional regulator [Halochromatium roseum]|uniref:MerR family transcriptional regulator n=1 Tax=Halochromatium roseum TaxID=391920 RepID=UPI001911622F|nr:MerR family transcriptional regulator [Halochromatium roseum]MBK5940975.1 MerR family transcriptional regulator [Halochromatium roseum]